MGGSPGQLPHMATSAWTGAISFGLVTIPVKLYPAVVDRRVHYHRIDTRSGSPIRMQKVSGSDGEEVPNDQIGKGYEVPGGSLVILDDAELDAISPKRSHTIEIEQFVSLGEIDPLAYDKPYQVVPDKSVVKPYALLCQALSDTGRVAIARFVMRTVEHLAAIRPVGDHLALSTLVFADELRDPADFPELGEVRDADITATELKVAEQLIDSMVATFVHAEFRDEHREQVLQLIEARSSGEDAQVIEPEDDTSAGGEVVDLVAALEKSVAAARKNRSRHQGDSSPPAKTKKSGKRSRKAS